MRFASILSVTITVLATSAQGALTLNVESLELAPGESGFLEVYATELPPAQNEFLVAYAIALNLPQGSPIHFGPGPLLLETTDHPFVFPGNTTIEDRGSDEYQIRAWVFLDLEVPQQHIDDNEGFLRVPVSFRSDYTGPCLRVPITFQLGRDMTELGDDVGALIDFVPVNGMVGGLLCPEPSSAMAVLFGSGLLALRRRRHRLTAA